jgi:hypothetical protein
LGEALDHVRRPSATRLDVLVDAPVERDGVIGSGMPARHQVIAGVQTLGKHVVGTVGVGHDILDS